MYRFWLIWILLSSLPAAAQVHRNDVVIDEIMADPSPPVALPSAEFLELKNVSRTAVNLKNWKIVDAAGTAVITVSVVLQPDSFLILCSTGSAAAFRSFGNTLGIAGFPSLDNAGEWLLLRSAEGALIHAVQYGISWYGNETKKEGGWTLEMIDPAQACSDALNWKASTDAAGGTPGRKNSVDALNPDRSPPAPVHSFAADSLTVILQFNEPLDSTAAGSAQKYSISDGIGVPQKAVVLPPLFSQVTLLVTNPLVRNKRYLVSVQPLPDCAGNLSGRPDSVPTGLASPARAGDLVINEILFNPKPDGSDYLELYNRSTGIFDLKDLFLANRATNGSVSNLQSLGTESRLLFPGDYLAATEDAAAVQRQYLVRQPESFVQLGAMPSLPNNKGAVVLLNRAGTVVDELAYDENWHFPLLDSHEGVALERIDPEKPTQDPANWHSAATTAGYGTPAYRNSQFMIAPAQANAFTIYPEIFSPDNDGWNDFVSIGYQLPQPGFVCTINLYNSNGFPVRALVKNALCGSKGTFRWDGLDDRGRKLGLGVYVVLIELFNLQGRTQKIKKAITLARPLK